jgi:hypothetical protein
MGPARAGVPHGRGQPFRLVIGMLIGIGVTPLTPLFCERDSRQAWRAPDSRATLAHPHDNRARGPGNGYGHRAFGQNVTAQPPANPNPRALTPETFCVSCRRHREPAEKSMGNDREPNSSDRPG